MGGLAGNAEDVGDLSPGRSPVQGAGDETLEVSLSGPGNGDLVAGFVEGVGLSAFVTIHVCQLGLTGWTVSGHPDIDLS